MDSLTQIVLGAAVGEACIGRKVGNKAIFWGAVAGTIPDLDVISRFFVDQVTALEMHRGFSHSIMFSLIFAPIFGWLISKIHKSAPVDWKDWTKLMFWGLFTHPLLDAHTTWGTQLFWPHEYRIAYKNIFVVDPLYTVPFLVLVILVMFQHRESSKRRLFNNLGLIISSAYMLLTIGLKGVSYFKFIDSLEKQGIEYSEVRTRPTPFNSILWCANVETENEYLIGYYSLLDEDNNIEFQHFEKNHFAMGDFAVEDKVQRLIKIAKGWFTVRRINKNSIMFSDLRFGQTGMKQTDEFVFSFEITRDENGEITVTETPKTFGGAKVAFGQLWDRVLGVK